MAANQSDPKMISDEVRFKPYLGEPSAEILEWAKANIREDPDTRCQMISDLRDMIYSKGECIPHRTDDKFLLRFLRARNFSMDAAYQLFVNYYDFKEERPELFENVKFSVLETALKHDILTATPYKDQTGRTIIFFKCGNWDPAVLSIEDVLRACLLLLELAILEERNQISGGRLIFDLANFKVQNAWYMSPSLAKTMIRLIATSFPAKAISVHVVNESWIFDRIFSFFKPFLNSRMTERLFFHGSNMESLHKHISPKSLPTTYGGVHPCLDYKIWVKTVLDDKQIVQEMESMGYIKDITK